MKVKINQYLYEIIECGDCEHVYLKENEDGYMKFGLHRPSECKIYIHKDLKPEAKRSVLAHELCHAFLYAHGIDWMQKDDELICNFVAIYHARITEIVDRYFSKSEVIE